MQFVMLKKSTGIVIKLEYFWWSTGVSKRLFNILENYEYCLWNSLFKAHVVSEIFVDS